MPAEQRALTSGSAETGELTTSAVPQNCAGASCRCGDRTIHFVSADKRHAMKAFVRRMTF